MQQAFWASCTHPYAPRLRSSVVRQQRKPAAIAPVEFDYFGDYAPAFCAPALRISEIISAQRTVNDLAP
jgi:hypothetical protein